MIRMGGKVTAGTALLAGLLALAAGPLRAAEEVSGVISSRVLDFSTCAKPEYPKADLRAGHAGQAIVLFLVASDGTVQESKIAKSSGYASLDEAARTALAKCRFAPAEEASDAARWYPVSYHWIIEGSGGTQSGSMSPAAREEAFLWTARVLARYRYKHAVMASDGRAPVLDRYLEALDPERLLFTRSDITKLESKREQLARTDESKQLGAAFEIFEQMRAHRTAMVEWTKEAIRETLGAPDGKGPEPRAAGAPWPASDNERLALWRQRAVDEIRSLRRAGSTDKDIIAILTRRNDNRLARVRALTMGDAFDTFMNAYVSAYDPHGAYHPPSGRAPASVGEPGHVGVGLVLKKQGEWITIHDMAGDGSAYRSRQLQKGERIVAVGQGAGQPMTDVVGWSVDEVVALVRGLPGSTVMLHVGPAGAHGGSAPRSVALVRGPVSLRIDAHRASAKVEVRERNGRSYRIAVVTIPRFYQDFAARRAGATDYASLTRDVAKLLETVKAQGADAVLLDMRGNGGGSLIEAIDLAGLFLPRAPVAQQRELDGKIKLELAPDGASAWDGPLGVLIDEGSAAATEIFAAAMQDHGRGLVIGDRSVGRATVQTLIGLDRFAPNPSVHYGELKLTVAQLFRVSGVSFEQAGVTPDIHIPGVPDPSGKAHQPGFPTVPVKPAGFEPRGELKALIPLLTQRHASRTRVAGADIHKVQFGEALHLVADQVDLLRTAPAAGQ